jgi:hypothetical protein
MSLFDRLPLDMIDHIIRPFITNSYFARLGVNGLLPPVDRQGTPLKYDAAKQLELSLVSARLKRLLERASSGDPTSKAATIGEIFDFFSRTGAVVLQHNQQLRNVIVAQATVFADPHCQQYALVATADGAALNTKARHLLDMAAALPFLYPITASMSNERWSPVSGLSGTVIVDNSRLLAAAAAAAEKAYRSTPHWSCVRLHGRYYGRERWYGDDDDDGDWEYGYFDDADRWVCIKGEEQVTRRGTVLEADGWERVVARRR